MGDAPAFQFYPSDWILGTLTFSPAEDGAYLRCVMHQWASGGVPADDRKALAGVMRVSEKDAAKLWATVSAKFQRGDDGLWRNARVEAERAKQAEYRQSRIDAGRRGGLAKAKQTPSTATVLLEANDKQAASTEPSKPLAKPSSSSSSSFSSSATPSTQNVEGAHTPRPIRHPSPLAWDRVHGRHVAGFCSWVCLPQSIFDEFVNRVIGAGASEPEAVAQVRAWAEGVRKSWAGRIPGDDIFAFWRNEWAATHGSNKPAATAVSDPLAGVREALRHV